MLSSKESFQHRVEIEHHSTFNKSYEALILPVTISHIPFSNPTVQRQRGWSSRFTKLPEDSGARYRYHKSLCLTKTPDYVPQNAILARSANETSNSILPYTQGLTGVNLWLNDITGMSLLLSLGFLILLTLLLRLLFFTQSYLRLLTTIDSNRKRLKFWEQESTIWSNIQKYLLVAPLFQKKHNEELHLFKGVKIGTIPSRLHTLFLSFYALTNIIYCCLLDYNSQPRAALLAEIRGRTAHLAVLNMIPLFLFCARNNPLIGILGISFDTFNLFHRWLGRIVLVEILAHTFIWGANVFDAVGLQGINESLGSNFIISGLVSVVSMVAILFQSPSLVRHAMYEIFLHVHQVLAIAALIGGFLHVWYHKLPQVPIFYLLICLWACERFLRIYSILRCNVSHQGVTKAHVKALEGGACRITFETPRAWKPAPGSHIYAYIPRISGHMSHPFSIAWSSPNSPLETMQGPTPVESSSFSTASRGIEADFSPRHRGGSNISCIISARGGMTSSLYNRAMASPSGVATMTAYIEGPYGGAEFLRSYGTVLLFAGGVGITHQISLMKDLVDSSMAGVCSTKKVILVWSVKKAIMLEWCREWLEEVVALSEASRIEFESGVEVKVLLYVTQQEGIVEETEESKRVLRYRVGTEIQYRRPDVHEIVKREVEDRIGAVSIGVCGPANWGIVCGMQVEGSWGEA
ncbi:hypothetical protein G7Y89_g7307 [Cudoniella acicularis]|uniref:FAD-binding FR-type domain-containing protein n=1 Tax=Cudoniella acicularis TaxID=354080 RepID=A0A8H4RJL8_9HELO|nr:hypothetical protein G7Y89_g7307 [Cudoniella acicularis]